MLTIYTPEITPRITFIMNVIFKEHLNIACHLTDSVEVFNQANLKISYAPEPIADEVFICRHTLMTETDIREQIITPYSYEDETVFFQTFHNRSFLPFDIFSMSFFLLSRYEEYLPHKYKKDQFNRFPGTESIAYQLGFLQKPLVDILVIKFVHQLQTVIPSLKFDLSQTKYLATYDIDNAYAYKYKGLTRSIGGLLKLLTRFKWKETADRIAVLLNKKEDPFDSYKYIRELQKKYRLDTYYFILFSGKGKYDRGLDPRNKQFQHLIKQLEKTGKVGIHPSFASSSDKEKLKVEIERLSTVLERKIRLSRSHFLMLNLPETYQNLIANGIESDFTLGYADQAGFRASSCKPFNFFDLYTNTETALRLYPLAYMEGTLQAYMKLSEEEGLMLVKQLMDSVKSVSGTFISLWHNETLGRKECKKFYEQTLDYFF